MNLKNVRIVGHWMMLIGGSMFTCGLGISCICASIHDANMEDKHKAEALKIDNERKAQKAIEDAEKAKIRLENDKLYNEKLKTMNQSEFAEFHAEKVARANQKVIDDSKAAVVEAKLKADELVNKTKEECLKRIEQANKERDDAVAKYKALDSLFYNKDKILKAKEYLDEEKKAKKNKDDALESIKRTFDWYGLNSQ